MRAGQLIREARKRAGISQRELAERLGTTQAVIARCELGRSAPPFDRVVDAIRACGFDLSFRITRPDLDHALLVEENLRMTPLERLERLTSARTAVDNLAEKVRRRPTKRDDKSAITRLEEKLQRGRQRNDL